MPSINFIDQQTVIPASWLNDVDQLTFDIPDNTSALKGAGLVPFNPALVYRSLCRMGSHLWNTI